ncbi:hypothetical protein HDV06_004008 [Boothiomyces sp. JEL0866]|nr:hypothetical protein HDV06_004008 [Boothiomyces sp. JEL0866]
MSGVIQNEKLRPWSGSIVNPKKERLLNNRRVEESLAMPVINIYQETESGFDSIEGESDIYPDYRKGKAVNFKSIQEVPEDSTSPSPAYFEKIIQLQELKKTEVEKPTIPKLRPRTPQRCFLIDKVKKKRPNTAVSFKDNVTTEITEDCIYTKRRPTTAKSYISDFNWDSVTRCQSSVPNDTRSLKSVSRPNTANWYNPIETDNESYKINVLIKRQKQLERVRPSTGRPSTAKTLAKSDSRTNETRPSSGYYWQHGQSKARYHLCDGELAKVPSFTSSGSLAPILQEKVIQLWEDPNLGLCTDSFKPSLTDSLADRSVPSTAKNSLNEESSTMQVPESATYHPASIIIMNGEIAYTSQSYVNFLRKVENLPKDLIEYYMDHLEKYVRMERFEWAECNVDRLIEILNSPFPWKFANRKEFRSLFINDQDIENHLSRPGSKYIGPLRFHYAALKIQTNWRMHRKVKIHEQWLKLRRGARIVWNAWQQRKKRIERRKAYQKRYEDAKTIFQKQSDKFYMQWKTIAGTDRIVVKINSASFSNFYRSSMNNQASYENLFDPKVSMIFVTKEMSPNERLDMQRIININFNYKELIESKRLILVELPSLPIFPERFSSGNLLLCSPESLSWIKFSISGMPAYIESACASAEECFLSQYFKIPVMGSIKAFDLLSNKRQNQRKFAETCRCEIAPGVGFLYWEMNSVRDVVEKVEELLLNYPHVKSWVFKMNETTHCVGLATFTPTRDQPLLGDLLSNLKCVNNQKWATPKAYLNLFIRHGGIIEAMVPVDYKTTQHPYFYFQILPDYTITSLGTCNMIPHRNFEFCGMLTPCNVNNKDILMEKALDIAKEFVRQKYMGFLAVEFIQWFDQSQNKLRKKARMAQVYDRVGICLWGLKNDMIAGLSNKSFECLCIENDIIMDLDYCGTYLPNMMQDELTKEFNMIVVDSTLEQLIERLFKNFVLLCRTLHYESGNNFLEYCRLIYDILMDKLPQYDKSPLPYHLNDLELFVYESVGAWGLFTDTKEDAEQVQPVQMLSTAAIQLLNLDIPSNELKLDPFYGKTGIVKPQISKTKIQPGTTTVEEYLGIMSTLADLGIQSDAKTGRRSSILKEQKRSMTFRKAKHISAVNETQ